MAKPQAQQFYKTIFIFAAIGYFLFLTYKSVLYNYNTNKKIDSLKEEIALLEIEEDYLANLNVYYQTDSYKELEARRKLGLKGSGETVIKIPIDEERLSQIENRETVQSAVEAIKDDNDAQTEGSTNPQKWLKYILKI